MKNTLSIMTTEEIQTAAHGINIYRKPSDNMVKNGEKVDMTNVSLTDDVISRIQNTKILTENSLLRIYGDNSAVQVNNIPQDKLFQLIAFNIMWRWGRGLLLNGNGIYNGSISHERMLEIENEIKETGKYDTRKYNDRSIYTEKWNYSAAGYDFQ